MKRPLKLKMHEFLKQHAGLYLRFNHVRGFNKYLKTRYGDKPLTGVTRAVWEFSRIIDQAPGVLSKATQYPDWVFEKKQEESN